MTVLVLEETAADLAYHSRILDTIPQTKTRLAADPAIAMTAFAEYKADLLVIDDAIEGGGVAWLKEAHLRTGRRDTPVIVLTANGDKDARRALYEYGVYNCIEKPIDPATYLCIARNALAMQVMRRNDASNVNAVVDQYKALQAQLEEREVQVIYSLLHTANLVDAALSRRMARVAASAERIAHRTSITHEDARRFGIAARVYDIGMLALPANVRERRTELTGADASRLLGPHAERATEIFGKSPVGLLDIASKVARSHHERFDGRGYPDGLAGGEISIYAQIVGIAEAFTDAMQFGVPAPGRVAQPLTETQALAFIERQTGTAFDPEAIEGLRLVVEKPLSDAPAPSA